MLNQQIKDLRALKEKKHRLLQRRYIAEGEKIVAEIVDLRPAELLQVICSTTHFQNLPADYFETLGSKLVQCEQRTLDAISALKTPSPILAVLEMPVEPPQPVVQAGLNLFLDGIRDPGNLGTILRIADWFGVSSIFLSEDCVDVFNPKTIQASMGAFLRVQWQRAELKDLARTAPNVACVGTRVEGSDDALDFVWPETSLLVIGSESHGIRPSTAAPIDQWVTIPSGKENCGSESLNAAVATGILCAAYLRSKRS